MLSISVDLQLNGDPEEVARHQVLSLLSEMETCYYFGTAIPWIMLLVSFGSCMFFGLALISSLGLSVVIGGVVWLTASSAREDRLFELHDEIIEFFKKNPGLREDRIKKGRGWELFRECNSAVAASQCAE